MPYEPTNWKSGDVVTSAKLNKMENGIEAANSGSLPAVTSDDNGDVLTVVNGAWGKADPNIIVLKSEQDFTSKSFNDMLGYLQAGKLVIGILTGENDGAPYGMTYILSHAAYETFGEGTAYIVKFACAVDSTTGIQTVVLGASSATDPLQFAS